MKITKGLKNKAEVVQEAWIAPTMGNGWGSDATNPVGYYKDTLGIVHLKGRMTLGTAATIAFTLPAAYLPSQYVDFGCIDGGGKYVTVTINPAGQVVPWTGSLTTFVSLDNISFRV